MIIKPYLNKCILVSNEPQKEYHFDMGENTFRKISHDRYFCYDLYKKVNTIHIIDFWQDNYCNITFWEQLSKNVLPFRYGFHILTSDGYLVYANHTTNNIALFTGVFSVLSSRLELSLQDLIHKHVLKHLGIEFGRISAIYDIGKILLFDMDLMLISVFVVHMDIEMKTLLECCKFSVNDLKYFKNVNSKILSENFARSGECDKLELYAEWLKNKQNERLTKEIHCINYNPDSSLYDILLVNKVFLWGLIGSKDIVDYSVAPHMWCTLFKRLRLPVNYSVINTDSIDELERHFDKITRRFGTIGFNVAMPWKQWAYEKCSSTNPGLGIYKTVNTLCCVGGIVYGTNTDGAGLVKAAINEEDLFGKNVLLLGAGGSAQTIPKTLIDVGISLLVIYDINIQSANELVNKVKTDYYDSHVNITSISLDKMNRILPYADVVINSTPCGMVGFEDTCIFTKEHFTKLKKRVLFVETVYNPYMTPLLLSAQDFGHIVVSGVNMLVEQAAESFAVAFGFSLSKTDIDFMKQEAKNELINLNKSK